MGNVASRSRPTTKWMFRGRARSSKWFVRSCSRLVPCWHWLWSLAMLRLPSAARLRSQLSATRSRLRSAATQLQAVQHQAAPLLATAALLLRAAPPRLAVLAVPHRPVPLQLAAAVPLPLLLRPLPLLLQNLPQPQLQRSKLSLNAGSQTACGSLSHEPFFISLIVFHFPQSASARIIARAPPIASCERHR